MNIGAINHKYSKTKNKTVCGVKQGTELSGFSTCRVIQKEMNICKI